jgi:murein DD-endopeptidase MepM/ murein hydrolase activator NlpD
MNIRITNFKTVVTAILVITTLVLGVFLYQKTHDSNSNRKAFLSLPFARGTPLTITEGWTYSEQEREIHGKTEHSALDIAAKRGTPVYAASDGIALASYQYETSGEWQGKPVGFGYGKFVQIWNPETETFVLYSHLDSLSQTIKYIPPQQDGERWNSELVGLQDDTVLKTGTILKKGDLIGYVGDSGLSWGYTETPTSRPDPNQYPSWDETHLHFEVFHYDITGKKMLDPYNLSSTADKYRPLDQAPPDSLWLKDDNGKVRYAK